jgi:hypothetical protein
MNNKLFVGDSNVYIFDYFRKYGAKIIKFKGAPMKGIVNKNDNYQALINNINRFKTTDLFLVFGVVDLNFYYYFKKYKEKKSNIFEDMKIYAKEYVKVVSELNVKNKTIIGILPSPIKDKYFRESLKIYGILSEDIANTIPEEDLLMVNRNKRIENINNILEEECKKYNVNFCNIFPVITKEYELIKLFSLGKYGKYNIHHKYEYLFIIFIKTCLNFLIKDKDFDKILNELKSVFNKYIKNRIYEDTKENHADKSKEDKDALYKKTKFSKKKILKFINNNSK